MLITTRSARIPKRRQVGALQGGAQFEAGCFRAFVALWFNKRHERGTT